MSRPISPSDVRPIDVGDNPPRDLIARAKEAYSNGHYSEAEALALQAVRDSEPSSERSQWASASLLLAEILIKQQKYDDALLRLHQVLEFVEPAGELNHTRHTLSLLGKIAYYKKNYPLALEYFNSLLAIDSDRADEHNFTAHYFSGIIYSRQLNFEQGLVSSRRALVCAEALNSPHKIAQVCITLGSIYNQQGNHLDAFSQFRRAEFISQSHGYSDVEAVVLQNLAMLLTSIGDLEQSLTMHHRLIEHYEQVGNQRLLGIECLNTGRSYFMMQNFERAAHFCERAIQLLSSLSGEEENCAAARLTLAEIYLHQHHSDLATSISQEAVSLLEESANKEFLLDAYSILGQSLYQSGDVQGAITYLKKAVDFFQHKHFENSHRHVEYCISLAKMLLAEEDFDTALPYFEQACAICERQSFKSLLPEIYLGLSKIYDKRGDLRLSYDFYRKYHDSSVAVFNIDSEKIAQRLSIQYDLRQKEQEAQREREKNEILSKTNQELQEANRLKNEFLSIAAHDLKSPLQSILGFSEIIQESETLDDAKAYAAIIARSASHMVNLVKSLIETAAIDAGKFHLNPTPCLLSDLLKSINENFRPALASKNQTLLFEPSDAIVLNLDVERMREVFSNLISNAIKYSPHGKTITVHYGYSTSDSGSKCVLIAVKDEGQGLSDLDKQKLFGQFQRLSARPTGGESSTGLGLWIAKQFVEKHGGRIWAESEGKGKGTTFFVELPVTT